MGQVFAAILLSSGFRSSSEAHDIPNARVDRATQVTLEPGRLRITYEVSLSELTLTQELRSLIGALPGSDRREWFDVYGRETGPLNVKGLLVTVDGEPKPLIGDGFDLVLEEHHRYSFRFKAEIPRVGQLVVHDTNFSSSEGTSKLAIRGVGVVVRGDDLPPNVEQIAARPVWQLSDREERRTRLVQVDYHEDATNAEPSPPRVSKPPRPEPRSTTLTRLLDREAGLPLGLLTLVAFVLGAAHAVQPGHGKTLVAATVVGERGSRSRGILLALITTLTHTGSVFLVAAALWWSGSSRFAEIHVGLTRGAGFLIAAVGLWRLGRRLGGFEDHPAHEGTRNTGGRGLISLGIAGGIVPCWDAVGLIVLAAAVGRLGLGLGLVVAFSLGMGLILVGVGYLAGKVRYSLEALASRAAWERRLGLASGLVLSVLGVYLLER